MRSDLVFGAVARVSNRFGLCKVATKATRMLHRPNTRLQDTINEVFIRIHEGDSQAEVTGEKTVGDPVESAAA